MRVEDVVLGCAVSVVVGLLFWPRGATAAFGQALCDAYRTGSRAPVTAVDRLASPAWTCRCSRRTAESMASYHRLEEAYRQFLGRTRSQGDPAEHGDSPAHRGVPARARRARAGYPAGSLRSRWENNRRRKTSSPRARPWRWPRQKCSVPPTARMPGTTASARCWTASVSSCQPAEHDHAELRGHLVRAFDLASEEHDAARVRMALRLLWADEYLDDEQESQRDLADVAQPLAAQARLRFLRAFPRRAQRLTGLLRVRWRPARRRRPTWASPAPAPAAPVAAALLAVPAEAPGHPAAAGQPDRDRHRYHGQQQHEGDHDVDLGKLLARAGSRRRSTAAACSARPR